MRIPTNISAVVLALLAALAAVSADAACAPGAAPSYEDIDRILLVRCNPATIAYPCFRVLLALDAGRITGGGVLAKSGVLVHGSFALQLSTPVDGRNLLNDLRDSAFLRMTPAPPSPVIDGDFNLLAIRTCGVVNALRTNDDIDDAAHLPWSVLLQRLQAEMFSLRWAQTSPRFDASEIRKWFEPSATIDLLDLPLDH